MQNIDWLDGCYCCKILFCGEDRKETENQVVDHLFRLKDDSLFKLGDKAEINDVFPDE